MTPAPPERPRAVARTVPIPEYQPLPRLRVRANSVARVQLTIGADGRVHDVNVQQGIGPNTGALIAVMQRWRFKPATENGSPVAAPFTVELSFHADE
jgi:TonB family protein